MYTKGGIGMTGWRWVVVAMTAGVSLFLMQGLFAVLRFRGINPGHPYLHWSSLTAIPFTVLLTPLQLLAFWKRNKHVTVLAAGSAAYLMLWSAFWTFFSSNCWAKTDRPTMIIFVGVLGVLAADLLLNAREHAGDP